MKLREAFLPPRAFTSSLALISTNYALRCDAKLADPDVLEVERKVRAAGFFELGDMLPSPFVKGIQPAYLDQPNEESVPVINTLAIQNLDIRLNDCRHISRDDFDALGNDRKLRTKDVLLTVDGGVSIRKPVLFDFDEDYAVDSHVVILRPFGLSPLALVYLLASPLGQMQFRRAESGASGQTTVTEDDIRRFIFPRSLLETIDHIVVSIEEERRSIITQKQKLDLKEAALWERLNKFGT